MRRIPGELLESTHRRSNSPETRPVLLPLPRLSLRRIQACYKGHLVRKAYKKLRRQVPYKVTTACGDELHAGKGGGRGVEAPSFGPLLCNDARILASNGAGSRTG
jgi:hypothetical protein